MVWLFSISLQGSWQFHFPGIQIIAFPQSFISGLFSVTEYLFSFNNLQFLLRLCFIPMFDEKHIETQFSLKIIINSTYNYLQLHRGIQILSFELYFYLWHLSLICTPLIRINNSKEIINFTPTIYTQELGIFTIIAVHRFTWLFYQHISTIARMFAVPNKPQSLAV